MHTPREKGRTVIRSAVATIVVWASSVAWAGIVVWASIIAFPLHAVEIEVSVTGSVEFYGISAPPFGTVSPGDAVTMTFRVDSHVFQSSGAFSTRGYEIDSATYSFNLGALEVELQDPFPAGETPYFVLRNDDPGVDGFIVATSLDFTNGVPLDVSGIFGQFRDNFYVTYDGGTLASLDILDALGSYGFAGLTVFNWTVDDGPAQPLGMILGGLGVHAERLAMSDRMLALLAGDVHIGVELTGWSPYIALLAAMNTACPLLGFSLSALA